MAALHVEGNGRIIVNVILDFSSAIYLCKTDMFFGHPVHFNIHILHINIDIMMIMMVF